MDELKLNITTAFMKNLIAKTIAKMIQKKLGYSLDILLNQIEIKATDGKIRIHIDADAVTTNDDLLKMIKGAGLD